MEHQRTSSALRAALLSCAVALLGACETAELSAPKAPKAAARPRDIPAVPPNFAESQLARRTPKGLNLKIYQTATLVVRGGAVSSLKSWMSKVKLDVPAFMMRHPTQGVVLFDTGLHPDMETRPAKKLGRLNYFLVPFDAKPGQNIVAQLKADGVDAEQVRWVVISHLHIDHAGMIEAFPNATVVVDRREWEYWRAKQAKKRDEHEVDPAALEPLIKNLKLIDLSSAPAFGAFDHGVDLFGDGSLTVLDLSGHTAGSLGAWLNLEEGPVLLAGDASWVLDNHEDLALPIKGHIFDLNAYWRRLYQMKEMQSAVPRLMIFPGHDLAPLRIKPRADVSLIAFPR